MSTPESRAIIKKIDERNRSTPSLAIRAKFYCDDVTFLLAEIERLNEQLAAAPKPTVTTDIHFSHSLSNQPSTLAQAELAKYELLKKEVWEFVNKMAKMS